MKKTHKYNELSNLGCITPGCINVIKKSVVIRKESQTPLRCFKCHQAAQARTENPCNTAREVKTGFVIGRKKGIYVDN